MQSASNAGDKFLFSGNWHESVPRALLLDTRLTPLERNAWQIFRLHLDRGGQAAFPGYRQLQGFLSSTPGARASHETIARIITILRLTRWLSLVQRRRDARTGRIIGNLYVLHDEPLTPFEALQIDPTYLEQSANAFEHPARAVRIVGKYVLNEITEDPTLKKCLLPTRIELLIKRFVQRAGQEARDLQEAMGAESEEGPKTPSSESAHLSSESEESAKTPSSESEAGRKPAPDGSVRNPKQACTVVSSIIKKQHTARASARVVEQIAEHLQLSEHFYALQEGQQHQALALLARLGDAAQQQAVLDEWLARCRMDGKKITNPMAYLFGLVKAADGGQFNPWAVHQIDILERAKARTNPANNTQTPETREEIMARRERGREQLKVLKTILPGLFSK
jgi:hypothetical protein